MANDQAAQIESLLRDLAEFVKASGLPPGMETPPSLVSYSPLCYALLPSQAALILEALSRPETAAPRRIRGGDERLG